MRLEIPNLVGYINGSIESIESSCRHITGDDISDYIINYHDNPVLQPMTQCKFMTDVREGYCTEIADAIENVLREAIGSRIKSLNFTHVTYNDMRLEIHGGDYGKVVSDQQVSCR